MTRYIILVVVLIALDQASKIAANAFLPFHQVVDIVPFFGLYLTYNTGIAFSLLSSLGAWGLIGMTVIIVAVMLVLWRNVEPHRRWAHLGFAAVIAGALGNLIDRIAYGHVVDYFLFHTPTWSFAVFNVADSFISVGAAFIIIDELFAARLYKSQSSQ